MFDHALIVTRVGFFTLVNVSNFSWRRSISLDLVLEPYYLLQLRLNEIRLCSPNLKLQHGQCEQMLE